jgi:hypothetical protein
MARDLAAWFAAALVLGCGTSYRMYPVAPDGRYKFPAVGPDPVGDRIKLVVTKTLAPGDWDNCSSFTALNEGAYIRTTRAGHAAIAAAWPSLICVQQVGESEVDKQSCRSGVVGAMRAYDLTNWQDCHGPECSSLESAMNLSFPEQFGVLAVSGAATPYLSLSTEYKFTQWLSLGGTVMLGVRANNDEQGIGGIGPSITFSGFVWRFVFQARMIAMVGYSNGYAVDGAGFWLWPVIGAGFDVDGEISLGLSIGRMVSPVAALGGPEGWAPALTLRGDF